MFPKLPDLEEMSKALEKTQAQMTLLVDGITKLTVLLEEQNEILRDTHNLQAER